MFRLGMAQRFNPGRWEAWRSLLGLLLRHFLLSSVSFTARGGSLLYVWMLLSMRDADTSGSHPSTVGRANRPNEKPRTEGARSERWGGRSRVLGDVPRGSFPHLYASGHVIGFPHHLSLFVLGLLRSSVKADWLFFDSSERRFRSSRSRFQSWLCH